MQIRTRPFARKRVLVDRRLQFAVCLHIVAYSGLLLAAIAIGIFAPLLSQLGQQSPNEHSDPEIVTVMLYMHQRFWFVAAGGLVLAVAGALRLSHRIAGPLVRYKRNLRLMADGQFPPPLRTRDGDFLGEEVACLNAAVAGLAERIEKLRSAQADLRRELNAAADAARFDGGEIDPAALLALSAEVDRQLAGFTVSPDLDGYVLVNAAEPALASQGGEGAR